MIVITDSEGKAINGLRLRPGQETTINITTEAVTGLYVLIQATRADFIAESQSGESESVARGNGQELLDSGLVQIKVGDNWLSLTEPVELDFLTLVTPQQLKIRVSSVGAAVGEVAFGLKVMYADLGEWTIPLGTVVKMNGYDGQLFYPFGPYYIGYPVISDVPPIIEGTAIQYYQDWQIFMVIEDYYLPLVSNIEFIDDKKQLHIFSKFPGTPTLINKFIGKGIWLREAEEPEPSNVDDTLLMLMAGGMGGLAAMEFTPVQGEDWTHELGFLGETLKILYTNEQWELHSYYTEYGDWNEEEEEWEEWEASELIAFAAGTSDKIPVLWTMTDVMFEGGKLTIIKKEEE